MKLILIRVDNESNSLLYSVNNQRLVDMTQQLSSIIYLTNKIKARRKNQYKMVIVVCRKHSRVDRRQVQS